MPDGAAGDEKKWRAGTWWHDDDAVIADLQTRQARPEDAELLLPLYEAVDRDELGKVDISLADVDSLLRDPRVALERSVLLTRSDGAPVGVMVPRHVGAEQPRIDLEVIVEPGSPELFETLVIRAEHDWADQDPSPVLELWVMAAPAREILTRRGYQLTATHARYNRDLTGAESPPVDCDGVRVRLAEAHEWPLYHSTLQRVFSDSAEMVQDPYDEWAARMRSAKVNDPSQWWLLEVRSGDGDWVVAGLLQGNRQDADSDGAWVKNFGLVPEFRGRGLGRYLLTWALATFQAAGYQRVGLGADLDNVTNALSVYDAAGFERLYTASRFSKQL